jgi:hypothetical protein
VSGNDELPENEVPTGFDEDNDSGDDARMAASLSLQLSKDEEFARQLSKQLELDDAAALSLQLSKDEGLAQQLSKKLQSDDQKKPVKRNRPAIQTQTRPDVAPVAPGAPTKSSAVGNPYKKDVLNNDFQLSSDEQSELQFQRVATSSNKKTKKDTLSKVSSLKQNDLKDSTSVFSTESMGDAPALASESFPHTSKISLRDMFNIDDTCFIATSSSNGMEFQRCVVKTRHRCCVSGLVTHYDVLVGNKRRLIEYQKAHHDFALHSEWKQKRKESNMKNRSDEQELIRLECVAKYQRGDLKFVEEESPDHGGPVPSAHDLSMAAAAAFDAAAGRTCDQRAVVSTPPHHDAADRAVPALVPSAAAGCPAPALSAHELSMLTAAAFKSARAPVAYYISDGEDHKECDYNPDDDAQSEVSSEGDDQATRNASGREARELLQGSKVIAETAEPVELSTISAAKIWEMFHNTKVKGGVLARTLLIAAKNLEPKICPPWTKDKALLKNKNEMAAQKLDFLLWASNPTVLEWIRMQIYAIVISKPETYRHLNAHHATAPKAAVLASRGDTVASVQASDNTVARIAHIACSSESRTLLNAIFGKKDREFVDGPDLQPAALWQDVADVYVNNPHWRIQQKIVGQLEQTAENGQRSSLLNVYEVPTLPVTGECVRLIFTQIKSDYTNLGNAVWSPTGCNATGEEMYAEVWKNYINGKYLFFKRPAVCMYVFKLWNDNESLVPKYCIKDLNETAKVRQGVLSVAGCSSSNFVLPTTPRTPRLFSSPGSQSQATTTSSSMDAHNVVASYFQHKLEQEQRQELAELAKQKTFSVSSDLDLDQVIVNFSNHEC